MIRPLTVLFLLLCAVDFSVNGEDNTLRVMNTRWFARGFLGVRL